MLRFALLRRRLRLTVRGGVFGAVTRQAELMAAAEEDTYTPPSDGKVSDGQVRDFLRVMTRAEELQNEKGERLRQIAEKADKEEEMSLSDFSEMMGGMTEVAGLQTAEMEVVKTGGGNWAEHRWVGQALRNAYIQRDGDPATEHNYALYENYEDELARFVVLAENEPYSAEHLTVTLRPSPDEITAAEIIDAYNNTGSVVKKKEDTHTMAQATRAFAHLRW